MSNTHANIFSEPRAVAAVMAGFDLPWYIAGGWAIDLFLSKNTRTHKDCEIGIFRTDQFALRSHLNGWLFTKVENGRLLPWDSGSLLELPIHEAYASTAGNPSRQLEILLNERDNTRWLFRKDTSVTRPLTLAVCRTRGGIPYPAPEIVLLYKAYSSAFRPEDEADFAVALPWLDTERRKWLASAICTRYPQHPWLARL